MKVSIDEILEARRIIREEKDWVLSDAYRDYLDSIQVFVFDTKDGQDVIYGTDGMTRQKLVARMNADKRADKMFDAWLFTINSKTLDNPS